MRTKTTRGSCQLLFGLSAQAAAAVLPPRSSSSSSNRGSGSASIPASSASWTDVLSLTPSLKRWVARRVQQDRIVKTAYNKFVEVRPILVSLQPFLPSSRFPTPASLQAALLQPAAQQALLLFHRQNKAGWKARTTVGNALCPCNLSLY